MSGNRWERVEELLFSVAESDLERCGEVGPALVAFTGEQLQFVAWLRPFEKGRYHDPMIEVLSLAMALDCDRLAVSISGRAWSLDDPVPPVSEEGDLRQRVHMVHMCDGAAGKPRTVSVMRPFELVGEEVKWGEEMRCEDDVEGWIPQVLPVSIRQRHHLRVPWAEVVSQALRVDALGHELYASPELHTRLCEVGARTSQRGRRMPRARRHPAGTIPTGHDTPVPPSPQ